MNNNEGMCQPCKAVVGSKGRPMTVIVSFLVVLPIVAPVSRLRTTWAALREPLASLRSRPPELNKRSNACRIGSTEKFFPPPAQ
jgi:hypothetical protein